MGGIVKIFSWFVILTLGCIESGWADNVTFADALRNVRSNCSGISEKLSEIKTLAGVGTAVSGVGTAVGAGAVATGIYKNKFDNVSDNFEQQINNFTQAEANPTPVFVENFIELQGQLADLFNDEELKNYMNQANAEDISPDEFVKHLQDQEYLKKLQDGKNLADAASKKFGNARTGLMATSAATNIASAVISGVNKIDADFAAHIGACMGSVKLLASMKMQAKLDGSASDTDIENANKIIEACDKFNVEDIEKINLRATGATVSSSVGAVAGVAATVTSGMANSESVRTSQDAQKEKNLNTASNVLAGVTTVASLTSTVFNATQIAAAKRVIETAEQCEEAIK